VEYWNRSVTVRPFPRVLALVAALVVTIHVLVIVFLGPTFYGSVFGNALQIFSSLLAAGVCFQAARRNPGFSRSFWVLVGIGMAMWGLADFGWAYYEIVLHGEPPPGSLIRFLFDTHGMFFVMAVFLNQDKQDSTVELPELLDFLQIGILFFLIYFSAYYLPAINLSNPDAYAREFHVMTLETLGIFLLALLQWRRSATRQARRLFGGLAAYPRAGGAGSTHRNLVGPRLVDTFVVRRILGLHLAARTRNQATRTLPKPHPGRNSHQ
jgi:hypothetical protein